MRISKIHKKAQPYNRKIHLPSGIWTYRVAYPNVNIRNPECTQTFHTNAFELNGMTEQEYYDYYAPESEEEYDEEVNRDLWITPSMVKKLIVGTICKEQ